MKRYQRTLALLALALLSAVPMQAANIIINNVDPPGSGFNDPTPAAPVGGNPGVTLGDQRRIVFEFAADIWGTILDSDVDIVIQATFVPLACTPTSAVLGSAGTLTFFSFPGGGPNILPQTWYHVALANKLIGFDLTPGPPDPGFLQPPFNDDIFARFNSAIDNNPNCLPGDWYYGLDNNGPLQDSDLLNVVMHEFAHGLGFANFVNENTGVTPSGIPDIYSVYTLDTFTGKHWNQMTNAERAASAVRGGFVVWDGPSVTAQVPNVLAPRPELVITAPAGLAGTYTVQSAAFGPAVTAVGTSGQVELANDGVSPTADGCQPLLNSFNGNIALVDRGGCTFVIKVANAQAAGASAVLVANNAAGLPPMGGADPTIIIPSVGITQAVGNAIKAALPGVQATIQLSATRFSGADDNGFALLYAPPTVSLGSSLSHWDTTASPNLLMEPAINDDLRASENVDLTRYQMEDIGWTLLDSDGDGLPDFNDDQCVNSHLEATVIIEGCNSGAPNALFADGCTITDQVLACAVGASNHGQFVSCVGDLASALRDAGLISGRDRGQIVSCAAGSSLP